MAEKLVPAIKPVPESDGLKAGGGYKTITTPKDIENKIGWKTGEQTGSIFKK